MFFEESKINDILNCENCENRLDEPRMLPCGKIICTECASMLEIDKNSFKCIQLAKEEVIQAAEEHHQKSSKRIAEFESECLAKLESKKMKLDENHTENSEKLVGELKLFKNKWNAYLRNTTFDENLLCISNEEGE